MWPTPHVLHRVAQCVGHPSQERLLVLDRSRSNWTPPGLEKGLEKVETFVGCHVVLKVCRVVRRLAHEFLW
jgi:hypothetical protein